MKKLTLTIGCVLAVAGAAFAQGTVNWASISFSGYTSQTNSSSYSPLFGGGATGAGTVGNTFNSAVAANGYHWELLYLPGSAQSSTPTTLAALNGWADAGLGASQTAAGSGRIQPVGPTTAAAVPWGAGITDSIVLAGWSSNLGSSWSQVIATLNSPAALGGVVGNAYFGLSIAGYISPGSADPGAQFIGGGANAFGTPIQSTLTPLYLIPIPEPTSLALAGLGGLSLLLFRRQRK
jgi:hypothetical protein